MTATREWELANEQKDLTDTSGYGILSRTRPYGQGDKAR